MNDFLLKFYMFAPDPIAPDEDPDQQLFEELRFGERTFSFTEDSLP
jgi:hypothetical protein